MNTFFSSVIVTLSFFLTSYTVPTQFIEVRTQTGLDSSIAQPTNLGVNSVVKNYTQKGEH